MSNIQKHFYAYMFSFYMHSDGISFDEVLSFLEAKHFFQYTVICFLSIVKGKQQLKKKLPWKQVFYFTTRGCQALFQAVILSNLKSMPKFCVLIVKSYEKLLCRAVFQVCLPP